jgi:hypothetical protein
LPVVPVRCGDDVFASDADARTPSAPACVVAVQLLRVIAASDLTRVLAHPFSRSSDVGAHAAKPWTPMRLIAGKSRAHSVQFCRVLVAYGVPRW